MSTPTTLSALALAGVLTTAGCGARDSAAADEAQDSGSLAPSTVGTLAGTGPWTATSLSGSLVTLAVHDLPLRPGAVALVVSVDPVGPDARPRSVDLVSPTMPIHGVVRAPIEKGTGSSYTAALSIPMEGTWAFYVSLDEVGGDAAEFVFEVAAPAGGGHQHQHGAAMADPATKPGGPPGVVPISKEGG